MAYATFEPNLFRFHFSFLVHSTHTYLPMKMEQTECSETSAYKLQTLGNYPKDGIQEKYNLVAYYVGLLVFPTQGHLNFFIRCDHLLPSQVTNILII